jgi:hypothetical protein
MGLLEKIAALFQRDEVPDEAKALLAGVKTTAELLHGLDMLVTRNELELEELNREIDKLERQEREEMERVRGGAVDGRAKQNVLRRIQRLRKQMDNYENRVRIFNRNVELHQTLIAKIQEIEAMRLRGVDESRIDQIIMEHSEELERYHDTMSASKVADEVIADAVSLREQAELARLEAEIVGQEPAEKEKEREEEEEKAEAREKEREKEKPAPSAVEVETAAKKPERARRRPIEELVAGVEADADADAEGPEAAEKPAPAVEKKQVELE